MWHRLAGVLACLVLLSFLAEAAPATRPNIVYILADDMGIGDVSCLNAGSLWKTPNLDRLAVQGRIFTDAHSASGVCTPSRYALMTGRYSWRGSLKSGVLQGFDAALLEPGRMTVASLLRDRGYATAMVGKWHLGVDWVRKGGPLTAVDYEKPFGGGPLAHGFDSFFGISASLDMPPYVYLQNDRSTEVPLRTIGESPKPKMWRAGPIGADFRHEEVHPRFLEKALAFVAERGGARDGKPFFLYLALASPHTPIVPTSAYAGKTGTTPYGDFVAQVDDSVGDMLKALDRHGLATNTLVIFTADNGFSPAANLEELRGLHHDPSAGYRGHKADLFEGGHRVPFIARWPGQVPAGTRCAQTIGQLDLLATCADLLGEKLPENAGEDSVSILPLLRGAEAPLTGREALVHHSSNGSFAVRQGAWKLLLCPGSGGWSAPRPGTSEINGLPRFQLYNLEEDRAETHNLAAEHPDIVQRLGRWLSDSIERGRSTPGAPRPRDTTRPWPQTAWREAFTAPKL
jgi:arylsulfatase A-like enzyme